MVSFGVDTLRCDRYDVVEARRFLLRVQRTNINSTSVQHEHHLPLVLVATDATVARAAEPSLREVTRQLLRPCRDNNAVELTLAPLLSYDYLKLKFDTAIQLLVPLVDNLSTDIFQLGSDQLHVEARFVSQSHLVRLGLLSGLTLKQRLRATVDFGSFFN